MVSVLLDVDGCVVDSNSAFLNAVYELYGKWFEESEVNDWSYQRCLGLTEDQEARAWAWVGRYYMDFDPYPGAIEGVQSLIDDGHPIAFVTAPSPHVRSWTWHRDAWLAKYFPGVPVVHTAHKYLVSGCALIDDKWSNVEGWASCQRGLGILWARPWNTLSAPSRHVCRTNDWNVVRGLLRPPTPNEATRVALARAP